MRTTFRLSGKKKNFVSRDFILLSLLFVVSCNQPYTTQEQDITAIEAMSKARAVAFNEGNAADIAIHFTEDAILMAPGQPASQGKEAVQAYYQSIFDTYQTSLTSYYDEVKVDGDLAYGRGFAEVVLTPKAGGEPVTSTAKYLNILQRQPDGSWKTTHDIWNGNETTQ
jgi:uncharacterized protein (TIGR02246 family)